MRKVRIRKLNNQGSTFVMAIIVITLVTMLAVAILAASTHNIAMKNVDRDSKATFYTAETVMDEVCAGTGLDGMNFLGSAYEKVITTLIGTNASGFEYMIDNEEANERFKTYFIESMLEKISGNTLHFESGKEELISSDAVAREKAIDYLKSFIKGYDADMAKIVSVGNIEAYKGSTTGRSYMIIIRDVAIQYKEEKNGEIYFSNITMDLEIQFPNMTVDFTATNRLNDYIKYVFIADDTIDIEQYDVKSYASIYAGHLIDIKATTNAAIDGTAGLYMESLATDENINVICGGNLEETSGTISLIGTPDHKAEFTAKGTNIWCTNIKTNGYLTNGVDSSRGANVSIGDTCNTFVKDDMTIDGQDTKVDLNGMYYGYSSDGAMYQHANSSAIILNGKRAQLTIGTSKLLLAGHSYVDLGNDDYYMLGESLSLRGDQEIYLVPSQYLGKNYGTPIPNPMSETTWNNLNTAVSAAGSRVEICNLSGFFAKTQGYLNDATPYTVKKVGDLVYLYLNFANKPSAAKYVADIANGSNGAPAYLQSLLDQYTSNLFEEAGADTSTGFVKITSPTAQLFAKGTLLSTDGSSTGSLTGTSSSALSNYTGASSIGLSGLGNDEFALTSLDLTNRYAILTHLLADLPWIDSDTGKKYIVNDVDSALWQKKDYFVSGTEMSAVNVFDTIVDRGLVEDNEYNETSKYLNYGNAVENYIKVIVNDDYIIPQSCTGGIVVATGNVYVSSDFTGMIIAGKSIYVEDNVTINNSEAVVDLLIKTEIGFADGTTEEDIPFSEYFYAYKHAATDDDSREQVKVETVDYKDIVKINNWRKYED